MSLKYEPASEPLHISVNPNRAMQGFDTGQETETASLLQALAILLAFKPAVAGANPYRGALLIRNSPPLRATIGP